MVYTVIILCIIYILLPDTGTNVSSYINMVCDTLKNTIPKAVVHCQVREAKRSLLNYFYVQVGKKEVRFFIFGLNFSHLRYNFLSFLNYVIITYGLLEFTYIITMPCRFFPIDNFVNLVQV